jgi:uncharacterized protein (UPF0332 family)
MRKTDFLIKLHKEGKLKLVEPSEEVRTAYLRKSESSLEASKILLEHEKFEEAVSTAYYSMYHAVMALFFSAGIKCENHSAAIILLGDVFGIDSSEIAEAKKERIDKQYYVDFSVTEMDVKDLINAAEAFNSRILDFIARLNNDKIAEYRKDTKKALATR